jgi:hypothetical protein
VEFLLFRRGDGTRAGEFEAQRNEHGRVIAGKYSLARHDRVMRRDRSVTIYLVVLATLTVLVIAAVLLRP